MAIETEWKFYGDKNIYQGYFAKPRVVQDPLPTVIVIQEIWGVDEHIQDIADRFAKAGYAAFAPDLYSVHGQRDSARAQARIEKFKRFRDSLPLSVWGNETERNLALQELSEQERNDIEETSKTLFHGHPLSAYLPQLKETVTFLRRVCAETKDMPVASVGFCMGGGLSALLAMEDELSGAVVFYGHAPDASLQAKIKSPILGFYGSLDEGITKGVHPFLESMNRLGKSFTPYIYEGAMHAFFNDTRRSYDVDAARDAFAKMLVFLNDVLA